MEKVEERIERFCRIYEQIYQRVSKLNPENSGEVALRIFVEVSKNLERETEVKQRSRERQTPNRNDKKLATRKQREAIHKFGVSRIPEDLSKEDASRILNKLIGYSKANDREAVGRFVEELNRGWFKRNGSSLSNSN